MFEFERSDHPVRVMTRKAKCSSAPQPARFSVSTSYDPNTRLSSLWEDATADFAPAARKGDHRSFEISDWAGQDQRILDAISTAPRLSPSSAP